MFSKANALHFLGDGERAINTLQSAVQLIDPETGSGTGIVFDHYSAQGLAWALGQAPIYDPEAMPDILRFLTDEAENVLAVYGAWDPWTAGKIEVDPARGSRVFTAPEMHHAAGIMNLGPEDRAEAMAMLQQMMGGEAGVDRFTVFEPAPTVARKIRADRRWLMHHIERENARMRFARMLGL